MEIRFFTGRDEHADNSPTRVVHNVGQTFAAAAMLRFVRDYRDYTAEHKGGVIVIELLVEAVEEERPSLEDVNVNHLEDDGATYK